MMDVTIEVICRNLPGPEYIETSGGVPIARKSIRLGIQRGEEVVDAVPADRTEVVFRPTFRVAPIGDGFTNFLGPYAKGTKRERFFYLAWLAPHTSGALTMFRRAKVHLSHLTWDKVEKAARTGTPLRVELSLTDTHGGPLCASVREPNVHWLD